MILMRRTVMFRSYRALMAVYSLVRRVVTVVPTMRYSAITTLHPLAPPKPKHPASSLINQISLISSPNNRFWN